jgi:hypothetical protein
VREVGVNQVQVWELLLHWGYCSAVIIVETQCSMFFWIPLLFLTTISYIFHIFNCVIHIFFLQETLIGIFQSLQLNSKWWQILQSHGIVVDPKAFQSSDVSVREAAMTAAVPLLLEKSHYDLGESTALMFVLYLMLSILYCCVLPSFGMEIRVARTDVMVEKSRHTLFMLLNSICFDASLINI